MSRTVRNRLVCLFFKSWGEHGRIWRRGRTGISAKGRSVDRIRRASDKHVVRCPAPRPVLLKYVFEVCPSYDTLKSAVTHAEQTEVFLTGARQASMNQEAAWPLPKFTRPIAARVQYGHKYTLLSHTPTFTYIKERMKNLTFYWSENPWYFTQSVFL